MQTWTLQTSHTSSACFNYTFHIISCWGIAGHHREGGGKATLSWVGFSRVEEIRVCHVACPRNKRCCRPTYQLWFIHLSTMCVQLDDSGVGSSCTLHICYSPLHHTARRICPTTLYHSWNKGRFDICIYCGCLCVNTTYAPAISGGTIRCYPPKSGKRSRLSTV